MKRSLLVFLNRKLLPCGNIINTTVHQIFLHTILLTTFTYP